MCHRDELLSVCEETSYNCNKLLTKLCYVVFISLTSGLSSHPGCFLVGWSVSFI